MVRMLKAALPLSCARRMAVFFFTLITAANVRVVDCNRGTIWFNLCGASTCHVLSAGRRAT